MKERGIRRFQAQTHMMKRLKEDRNQHYNDLGCACYQPGKGMAKFKEQPPKSQCYCCSSQRYNDWLSKRERLTMQERRAADSFNWYEPMDHLMDDLEALWDEADSFNWEDTGL